MPSSVDSKITPKVEPLQPTPIQPPSAVPSVSALESIKQPLRVVAGAFGMVGWVFKTYYEAIVSGAIAKPRQPKHRKLIHDVCGHWARVLGLQINVHGQIPLTQGLWVANHVSWVDAPVIGSVAPAFFVGKAEVKDWPIVGKLVAAGGVFFVKRGSGDAVGIAEQMAEFIANENESVIFFPEATTTDGRRVYRIHAKLLQASIDSGKPVQPLLVCYQNYMGQRDTVVPWVGKVPFLKHFVSVLKQPPVTAHVMAIDPIYPDKYTKEELRDVVQSAMNDGFNQLHTAVFGVPVDPTIAEEAVRF